MLNLSRKIKSDKGSITSFTLLSMLFFLVVVIAIYASVNTKIQKQEKEIKSVQDNYKQENIDDIYGNTLNGKAGLLATYVKVGDYVSYEPEALNEANLNTLKNNLNTYSGKSDSTINSAINRDELKWRVLDVNEKTGQVRLISAEPTSSKIELYGYNGYNNAVKLIDDACSTLYNNSKLASKVQNLKIEDIQDKMIEKDYTKITTNYTKIFNSSTKYYPSIFSIEKEQKVNDQQGKILNKSEQEDFINQTKEQEADSLEINHTYWGKAMSANDYQDEIYNKLFINDGNNNYSIYWLSSRCITYYNDNTIFYIRVINNGVLGADRLYHSDNSKYSHDYTIRPVVTLKSNIRIDTTNTGEGTESSPYNIKL